MDLLLHSSVFLALWASWCGGQWLQGRGRQGVTGSAEERQSLQPPRSCPSLGSAALRSCANKKDRSELGEWLRFAWPPWLSSLSTGDSVVRFGKVLHSGRHRTPEWLTTGAASLEGSSILCLSQQRKEERSCLLHNMYIFQYVSEVHTSKKWHISAAKLQ